MAAISMLVLLLQLLNAPYLFNNPVTVDNECVDVECDDFNPDEVRYADVTWSEAEMGEKFISEPFEMWIGDAYYVEVEEELDEFTIENYGEPDNLLFIKVGYEHVAANQNQSPYRPDNFFNLYADNFLIEEYARMHDLHASIPGYFKGDWKNGLLVFDVPDGVEVLEIDVGIPTTDGAEIVTVEIVVEE